MGHIHSMTPEHRAEAIADRARDLIKAAEEAGVSLRIDRQPLLPLSMGNARHVVETWPARKQPWHLGTGSQP